MAAKRSALRKTVSSKLRRLMREVLLTVKPSEKDIEDANFAINEIMGRLKLHIPRNVEILLAGSVARGTHLKGSSDIDIFLLYPRTVDSTAMERKSLDIAKRIVNRKKNESYVIKYAEHPYAKLILGDLNINVDVVPAYKIRDAADRGTAVDRTQLHNKFINSKLSLNQRDDVRVLKTFLKAHRIYGAEARTEGFSGYLCELLTYRYKSFEGILQGMANLKLPTVIDFSKQGRKQNDMQYVKKFGKRFIVIDPTDSNRNVAANVSEESLSRFMFASRSLLNSPTKSVFYNGRFSDAYSERKMLSIKNRLGVDIYLLHFNVPDIAQDIIWQQVKRSRTRLSEMLTENGFSMLASLQEVDGKDAIMGFLIDDVRFKTRKVTGPPVEMREAVEEFTKAHRGALLTSIDRGKIYTIEAARYRDPEELIRSFLKSKTTKLPSNLNPKKATLYVNKIPERYAKMLYIAYCRNFTI